MTGQPPIELLLEKFPQITRMQQLKTGGFKVVYKAEIQNKIEAFKVIKLPEIRQDEIRNEFRNEVIGRIKREFEALEKCNIPELVKIGSIRLDEFNMLGNDYVSYSEEFLEGSDLWDLIKGKKEYPDEHELRTLVLCLLRAIKELWRYGYIHRDIKPHNIIKLQTKQRPFVLLDLGIADNVRETALTYNPAARFPVATYRYMAPERASYRFRSNLDYRRIAKQLYQWRYF